jgi:dihydroneopterin aldolase
VTEMDRVTLRGLRGFGRHGVLPHERRDGQSFVVDVAVALDTRKAAASDDLADTVDYGGLAGRVVAVVEGEPVNLIETLAERIADVCLAEPRVEQVEVTVHKPSAPVAVPVDDVTVTISRSRS